MTKRVYAGICPHCDAANAAPIDTFGEKVACILCGALIDLPIAVGTIPTVPTSTAAGVKAAMSVKLKLKSTGYEATVRGADPGVVVAKCVQAHSKLVALRNAGGAPAELDRATMAVMILQPVEPCPKCRGEGTVPNTGTLGGALDAWAAGDLQARAEGLPPRAGSRIPCPDCKGRKVAGDRWILRRGDGMATPFDPAMQRLESDFPITVDLALNTKGVGWEITTKGADDDEGLALWLATNDRLLAAFPKGGA